MMLEGWDTQNGQANRGDRRLACRVIPQARPPVATIILFLCVFPAIAAASEPWVKLPVGTTRLTDLGAYRVSYQLAGGKRVDMPVGWSGYFTEDVGIAFYDAGTHGGRRAHVLHSPWKGTHGSVTLEYFVELPDRKPVTLRFGIAMRPDITEKSDGVTFSAFTVADGQRTEVAREHYTQSPWKDFSIDLSAHAGKKVIRGIGHRARPAGRGRAQRPAPDHHGRPPG